MAGATPKRPHPQGLTKSQIIIKALKDRYPLGVSYTELCDKAYGGMTSTAKPRVTMITCVLRDAGVVRVEELEPGHRDLWYYWVGK